MLGRIIRFYNPAHTLIQLINAYHFLCTSSGALPIWKWQKITKLCIMFWNKFGKSNLNIFCIFCQLFLAWFCFRKKYLSFFVFVTNCINTWTFLLCLTNLLFVYRICMIPNACYIYYYLKLVSKNNVWNIASILVQIVYLVRLVYLWSSYLKFLCRKNLELIL